MSDTQEQTRAGVDVGRLEKVISRVAAVAVLGGLAGFLLFTGDRAPVNLALALIGVFALAKLVVLVVGVREKWPAWPAVVLELLAFLAVGAIVAIGPQGTGMIVLAVAVAVLLLGAALVRRRAAAKEASDG